MRVGGEHRFRLFLAASPEVSPPIQQARKLGLLVLLPSFTHFDLLLLRLVVGRSFRVVLLPQPVHQDGTRLADGNRIAFIVGCCDVECVPADAAGHGVPQVLCGCC